MKLSVITQLAEISVHQPGLWKTFYKIDIILCSGDHLATDNKPSVQHYGC